MPSPIDLITQRSIPVGFIATKTNNRFLFGLDLFVCIDDDHVTRVTESVASKGRSWQTDFIYFKWDKITAVPLTRYINH